MSIPQVLELLSPILIVVGIIAGYLSLRSSLAKSQTAISLRVREELQAENEILRSRLQRIEQDRDQQDRILTTIRYVLKQRGLRITIDGDFVTLDDGAGQSKVVRIQDKLPKNTRPPVDNDEVV
jgi:hypothetical protein